MMQVQVQKLNWWHERLMDWMLSNPDKYLKDAAEEFNVTPQCIYIVVNSDAFKRQWAEVSGTMSHRILETHVEKMDKLAHLTLDVLHERIQRDWASVDLKEVREAGELALRGLGIIERRGGVNAKIENTVVFASRESLERARAKQSTLLLEDNDDSSGE